MREYLGGEPAPGRALIENGEPVAGSMSRTAAALLFDRASARIPLDARLTWFLQQAATRASALTVGSERIRAGAALAFAVERAVTRTHEGRTVRADGFLGPEGGDGDGADGADGADRTPAHELAEAVVLAARQTAEEWRVRHLGYLLAEAAVSPELDAGVVLRGLRLATALTGRQLVLLAAVGRRDRVPLPLRPLPEEPAAWRAWGALDDVTGLREGGLLDPPPPTDRPGAVRPRLRATDLRLTRRGVLLHRLLALDFVREDAVAAALADLGLPRS